MMNSELITFLNQSPTPFHATENLAALVQASGFKKLSEKENWNLVPGEAYYVTRSGSSFLAFVYGSQSHSETGIRILGAHTDSPCLKLKPQPEKYQCGYQQFTIEVYGGALLNPWFDRDLSIAGKLVWRDKKGKLKSSLVDFRRPMASIPSLAIHLDRDANIGRTVNPELHMNPLWCQAESQQDFRAYLKKYLLGEGQEVEKVLDFNLSFYDCQGASLIGENEEFIAGARLDNLLSCFVCARALVDSPRKQTTILVCNDHEEVGSNTDIGAQGSLLSDVLARIEPDALKLQRTLRSSVMASVDNAHGVHPNYQNKHEKKSGPLLNRGPVIKYDAKQGYATSSDTAAMLSHLASLPGQDEIPMQSFTMRADMRCGSTIGPITAAKTGVQTVDLGVSTFAMHSIRELAGAQDTHYLYNLLCRFIDSSLPNS